MSDGIVLINKPLNYTSRDIVNIACKKLNTKKVGHCGTLDPLASGVLVLCVGNATKLVPYITDNSKQYIATMELGRQTTTGDLDGEIVKIENVNVSDAEIKAVFASFPCKYIQTVPIYSAVKVNGKRLYEYARSNTPVELPQREVLLDELQLIDIERKNDKIIIKYLCEVSKGTYIRSLCNDLAEKLGTVSVMTALERTVQGLYNIEECQGIDDDLVLIDINDVKLPYPKINLTKEMVEEVRHGRKLKNNGYEGLVTLYYNDELIAIYSADDKDMKSRRGVKVWK